MTRNIPTPVINILELVGNKILTFSNKDLVYKDDMGNSYGRYEIDWALDHGLVVRSFSRTRFVWEFRKK
jgi:hypothetical protein